MEDHVALALERWAEEYNEEFGLRDAKRTMRKRQFINTVDNWVRKAEGTNKQVELDFNGFLLGDFDRDLQWLPHSHNPDNTLNIWINYAMGIELLGKQHTAATLKTVTRIKNPILSYCLICTLFNKESKKRAKAEAIDRRAAKKAKVSTNEKRDSWDQWLRANQHLPGVKALLSRSEVDDAKA